VDLGLDGDRRAVPRPAQSVILLDTNAVISLDPK